MEYYEISPGFSISRILTGLWQIADMEKEGQLLDPEETAHHLAPYVEAGFTTFDMADHYGSAELIAGQFHTQHPLGKQAQMLTKWVPRPGRCTKEEVRQAVETALSRLKSESLDMLQYHAWNYADPSWLEQMFWLQELKAEGLIKHLGVTNVDTPHLRQLLTSGIEVVTNQVSFSLIDQRASKGMAQLCNEFGVRLLAFGTVGGGFLSEKWLGQAAPQLDQLPNWSLMKYKRFIDASGGWESFQYLLEAAKVIADKHDVSVTNVAVKYILEHPAVAGVIVGARLGQSEHTADNARLFTFQLDDEDQTKLEQAVNQRSPVPGDCGDEYRKPPFLTASGDLSHHVDHFPAPYKVEVDGKGNKKVLSGVTWETEYGYCRAIRTENRILVSGTTASLGDRLMGGSDPHAQAHFVIDKIEGAVQSLGGQLKDVVRTRVFVQHLEHWEAIARAHGQRFGEIKPANTLVQASLVGSEFLVEMEAEALL